MTRYWLGRAAGSWTARLAAMLVAIALVAGFTAAARRVSSGSGPDALAVGLGAAVLTRPSVGAQLGVSGVPGQTLQIQLDDLLSQLASSGARVLDRKSLLDVAQRAVGTDQPVEDMRLADVLQAIPNVEIVTEGRSIVLGPRAIRLLARLAVGRQAGPVDELTVGELLDELPPITLGPDGTPSRLDSRSSRILDTIFGGVQKVNHAVDPGFQARLELEQNYESVVQLVKDLKREGYAKKADSNAIYDEAYNRLLTSNQEDLIPLLDSYLRLQDEYASTDMSSMSVAERIQFRWDARRTAFGNDTAAMIFGRDEAMERYQVDMLNLQADDYSTPADKAKRLAERRQQLKVELAAMGSYVGFPDDGTTSQASPAPNTTGASPADTAVPAPDNATDERTGRSGRRRVR